jgi:hypothetical protein
MPEFDFPPVPPQSEPQDVTFDLSGTPASQVLIATRVDGDPSRRFTISADGTMSWGVGNAPADVSFNHSAARTLTVSSTGAGVALSIDNAAGTTRDVFWSTAGSPRWIMRTGSAAESGGNAGSDFFMLSRADNGGALRTDLTLTRSSGIWAFGGQLSTAGPVNVYTALVDTQPASQLSAGRMSQGPGGATTLDMYFQRVAGSISGAWEMGPLNAGGNMQLQLVPSATVPLGGITSQIILFNVSGANFERFAFSCVNGGYIIDSTKNGSGSLRPISISLGSTASVVFNANPSASDGSAGTLTLSTSGWTASVSSNFVFTTDNANDIGATAATRPRTIYVGTDLYLQSNTSTLRFGASADGLLTWDAANTLAFKNGTVAQTVRIYGTTTGSHYLVVRATATTGDIFTNTADQLRFGVGGAINWLLDGSGHLIPNADNTYDFGRASTLRVRNVFVAGYISVGVQCLTKTSSPYNVPVSEQRTEYDNNGAGGQVIFNLPASAVGLVYTFVVVTAQNIRIAGNGTDVIRVAGSVSTATTGHIDNATVGGVIRLSCHVAGTWIASYQEGTWTLT